MILFLFRRDLRIHDNTALCRAIKENPRVPILPLFVLTPEQADPKKNKFFSPHAFAFMLASLQDLYQQTHQNLMVAQGDLIEILSTLHKQCHFTTVYVNADYTPYSKQRDARIADFCTVHGIKFSAHTDALLLPTSTPLYQRFTPFYNYVLKQQVPKPELLPRKIQWATCNIPQSVIIPTAPQGTSDLAGGRTAGLARLEWAVKNAKTYDETRNTPSNPDSTTRLGAYLKFGCISIREAYWALQNIPALLRELIFREFYYHLYHAQFEPPEKYTRVAWRYEPQEFTQWKKGKTGFPLVDAGMRALVATGWMHNRVRMVTASFLVKDMLHDWHKGERWFAHHLVDYDPIQNRAGWLWSLGYTDGSPYFRMMSPFAQSKTYDPEAAYIKEWIPELRDVPAADIHRWNEPKIREKYPHVKYPAPILDHKEAYARARATLVG